MNHLMVPLTRWCVLLLVAALTPIVVAQQSGVADEQPAVSGSDGENQPADTQNESAPPDEQELQLREPASPLPDDQDDDARTSRQQARDQDDESAEPPQPQAESSQGTRARPETNLGANLTLGDEDRLIVRDVIGGLAGLIGLRQDDVIVSVDGRSIRSPGQFRRFFDNVDNLGAERVPVIVLRDGRRVTLYFDPERWGYVRDRQYERDDYRPGSDAWLGVTLDRRYDDAAVVRNVVPDSPAEAAGVRQGDWIVRVNGRRVSSPSHLTALVSSMQPGQEVEVEVARRVSRTLVATLEGQDRSPARQVLRPLDGQDQYRIDGQEYRFVEPWDRFDTDRDRRGLRDRFGPEERGLRDRLDRDEVPDEPSIFDRP
jgi:hypothetical protein